MAHFIIQSITYTGEVKKSNEIGEHLDAYRITPRDFRIQANNDLLVTIQVDYQDIFNNKINFEFSVTTIFLIVGINRNNIDNELHLISFLLIKSFAHFQAILAAKFQDINESVFLPNEPDYTQANAAVKEAMYSLYNI